MLKKALEIFSEMSGIEKAIWTMVILLLLSIPLAIYGALEEEKKWEAFKLLHECKQVSFQASQVTTGSGISSNGKPSIVTVIIPSKTGWLCNDGITYYR